MSVSSIVSKLKESNVDHRIESCNGNGFFGTRIVYPNRKSAIKAEKVMGWSSGDGHVRAFFKEWATEYY